MDPEQPTPPGHRVGPEGDDGPAGHAGPATRYGVRLGIAFVLYAIGLVASLVLRRHGVTGPVPWLPALLVLPAVLTITWAVIAYSREADEFARRKLADAILIGFAISTPIQLAIGILQYAGFPALNWTWAFVVAMGGWLVGALVAAIRYR